MLPVRRAGGRASLTRTYAEAGSRGAFSTGPGVELLIIRDAVVDDETALRDLFRRSSLSNERDREALLAHPEALEYTAFAFTQRRVRVAVDDDDDVGFAAFSLASRITELNDLFVDPDFMGRGIGRALVADVVATSRSLGAAQVEVTANEDAAGFYEKAGFTFDGEVATRFGTAPRMRRDVDPRVSPTRTTPR